MLLLGEAGIGKSRYERRSMLITANQPFGPTGARSFQTKP